MNQQRKKKLMAEDDDSIKILGKNIMETLDNVNKKVMVTNEISKESISSNEISSKSAIDYRSHLVSAFSKIPEAYEHECME